ncbi:MAG: sigma-70 family RNA polymerase sigma factor [Polyangiales bacterium]
MLFTKQKRPERDFGALFREHAPFVWRVLRRHGVREADLEDACQEVFTIVHRRLPEFEGRAQLRTWIYEIARRVALAHGRKERGRGEVSDERAELRDADASPERVLERKRAMAWLEDALTRLSELKREAFVLYELEEMTLAEVAEALGCGLNTAHYRVTTAREELRAMGARSALATTPSSMRMARVETR